MALRRFHYDLAFEHYLRSKQIPYVAVDEAKKALHGASSLKSFDFVVYSKSAHNLLVDVKGRKHSGRTGRSLQNWVMREDAEDLTRWEEVFGAGFRAAFVFLYWCDAQPPDALFHEVFEFNGRWYAVLAVTVGDYRASMSKRSERWETVHVPAAAFMGMARPLMELL